MRSSFPTKNSLVSVAQKSHAESATQFIVSMWRQVVGGSMSRAYVTADVDDDAIVAFLMFCLEIYQAEQQRKRKLH